MNSLAFRIARRYLFARKSTNAINVIAGIAVSGVVVGSAAFIIILSAFNGFEDLIGTLFSTFNPEMKITAAKGKVFTPDSTKIAQLRALPDVQAVSATLEEIALFTYEKAQTLGTLKGVDSCFTQVTAMDSMMSEGRFEVGNEETNLAAIGAGVADKLMLPFDEARDQAAGAITVFMPKRSNSGSGFGSVSQPFKSRLLLPVGTFEILQDFSGYVVTNLDFVRELLSYSDGEVSAIEVKLKSSANAASAERAIKEVMGSDFEVRSRREQDATFFKVTNMERWAGYAILSFAFLIVAFNLVGALSMLVIEKKRDIAMLKSMGATDSLVRNIFLMEGTLLALFGTLLGFIVATALCVLQQVYGFVRLNGGSNGGKFIIDAYPISLRANDYILVFFTILIIALLASWLPAQRAAKVAGVVRDE